MKKFFTVALSTIALLGSISSCSSDEPLNGENNKPELQKLEGVSVVLVKDGKILPIGSRAGVDGTEFTLSFDSEESFQKTADLISNIPEEERVEFIKDLGITPLCEVEDIADKELDEIGEKAASEEEFRKLYAEYVEKYSGILIPNNIDLEDLNLYLPGNEDNFNAETLIANSQASYIVGDEIRKVDLGVELRQEVMYSSLLATNDPNTGSSYISNGGNSSTGSGSSSSSGSSSNNTSNSTAKNANEDGKIYINECIVHPKHHKKIVFWVARRYDTVHVKMEPKKKMWFGWKKDGARDCIIEPFFSPNFRFFTPLPLYIKEKSSVDNDWGVVTNSADLTGTILFWTDMSLEYDTDGKIIKDSYGLPKRLASKAYEVTVKLPRK